jgi:hypothetical protein
MKEVVLGVFYPNPVQETYQHSFVSAEQEPSDSDVNNIQHRHLRLLQLMFPIPPGRFIRLSSKESEGIAIRHFHGTIYHQRLVSNITAG